jgi:hypothetical protein
MREEDLKPCPVCKTQPRFRWMPGDRWSVRCGKCGAFGATGLDAEAAAEKWAAWCGRVDDFNNDRFW